MNTKRGSGWTYVFRGFERELLDLPGKYSKPKGRLLIAFLDGEPVGYEKMRLDTHPPKMGKAVKLYESHGFRPIEPYYSDPHNDVLFMELAL